MATSRKKKAAKSSKESRSAVPQRRDDRLAEGSGAHANSIDRNVDKSPDAVEHRRESQSGPGATGVPHTGPGTGTGDNPKPVPGHSHMRHTDDEDDDVREAMEDEASAAEAEESEAEKKHDEPVVADEDDDLEEPERDKIDPHTRHER